MRNLLLILLTLFIGNFAAAVEKEADQTKGKVFDLLADHTIAINEMQSREYAFVATGTQTNMTVSHGVTEAQVYFLGVHQDDEYYHASGIDRPSNQWVFENWKQRIDTPDATLYRDGNATGNRLNVNANEENMRDKEFRAKIASLRFGMLFPVEIAGIPPKVLRDGTRKPTELGGFNALWLHSDLIEAKYDESGNVFAHWRSGSAQSPLVRDVKITYGKKSGWMPIKARFYMSDRNTGTNYGLSSGIETTWEKHGDFYVPEKFHMAWFSIDQKTETQHDLELQWKFKLKPNLIQPEAIDWREPVSDFFGGELWRSHGAAHAPAGVKGESK